MRAGFTGQPAQLWLTTVARVALGAVMVTAGALKISDPGQAVRAVQAGKAWRYLSEILRDLLFLGFASWIAVFPSSRFALDPAALEDVPV